MIMMSFILVSEATINISMHSPEATYNISVYSPNDVGSAAKRFTMDVYVLLMAFTLVLLSL